MASTPPDAFDLELQRLRTEATGPDAFDQELQRLRTEAAQPQALTTPIELPAPPQRQIGRVPARPGPRFAPTDPFSEQERAAAAAGVDVTTGAPTGRASASFAGNEAIKAEFLRKELTEFFDSPVRMRIGPDTGELEFFNPDSKRFTTVDEATLTSRDLADFLGAAPPVIGAGIGEVLGGPLGGVAGAAAGEVVTQAIAGGLGISGGIDEALIETGKEAALAGAGSAVTRTIGAGVKGVRNVFAPRPISADIAETALSSAKANQAIADEISDISGQRFRPLTGQLAESEELLGVQSQLMGAEETAVVLRQRVKENETALDAFFEATTPTGAVPSEVGRTAQRAAKARTDQFAGEADRIANSAEADLRALIDSLPRRADDVSGERIRDLVVQERRVFDLLERQQLEQAQVLYGLNPETGLSNIQVPLGSELKSRVRTMSAAAREAIFPQQAAGQAALSPEALTAAANAEGALAAFAGSNRIDLHQLEVAIRALRANPTLGGATKREVDGMIEAMVRTRAQFLTDTNPTVLAAIESAEQLSKARTTLFDKSILRSILKEDDAGNFILTDRDVISRTIASGDSKAIAHLERVLKDSPEGSQELQKSLLALYRNEVVQDGLPNSVLHKRFMDQHGETFRTIFPGQKNLINAFGRTIEAGESAIARVDLFKDVIKKSFRGRLQNVEPENVIKSMFTGKFSVKDANRFRNMAKVAGFEEQYERAVGDEIRRRAFSNGVLSPAKLETLLADQGETLTGLMGPQYVKDLNTLLTGLRIAGRTAPGIPQPISNTLMQGIRAVIVPPLSRRGRISTFGIKTRGSAMNRVLLEAVTDPKKLRAIIANRDRDITSQRVIGLLGAMGGASAASADELSTGPIVPGVDDLPIEPQP